MRVTITADTGPVMDRLADLGTEAPRALVRALNRSLVTARTAAVRLVAADLGVPQKIARGNMRTERATAENQVATLDVSDWGTYLIDLGPQAEGSGVSYRAPGGRRTYPGGFRAVLGSGHKGIFARSEAAAFSKSERASDEKPRGRWVGSLPIFEAFARVVPESFIAALPALLRVTAEAMQKNLVHEVSFAAQQLGFTTSGDGA